MGDVIPIYSQTVKLPNRNVITFSDKNIIQALYVRHLMGQMDISHQHCLAVTVVRTVNPAYPHHVLAPCTSNVSVSHVHAPLLPTIRCPASPDRGCTAAYG